MKDVILKYALHNAVKFNGKANPGAVIGKVLAENPKQNPADIGKQAAQIVKQVNALKPEEQRKQLEELSPELLEKKKKEKRGLPELPNAKQGKVVTRIPPEPSKYNHIGHALSFLLNYLYAQKYKGKCILRFEDTNPQTAEQEYVDAMKDDVLNYLDIKPDKTIFASDELPKLYEMSEQLIMQSKAYMCFCERGQMSEKRRKGLACKCRSISNEANLHQWLKMLDGKFSEGQCSLRLKIDMESPNHVMRDPVIMRICTTPHYRQKKKYNVWPMYDFENAILDSLNGVTHILRSIEFGTMRVELQNYIKYLFKLPKQEVIQYGRFNITGSTTQGREIRKLIEEKKVLGWDDPRLVTLRALKRRGIVKEAFYGLALKVGLSKAETNLDFTMLSSINRKLLDASSERYFFVEDPVKVNIQGAPEQELKLKLHPDKPKKARQFKTADEFYITKQDKGSFKQNKLYRLMDCLNFKKKDSKLVFDSLEHDKYKQKGEKIVHWLPVKETVDVEILMPDAKLVKGYGEKNLANLKEGEVIQFERFGFCRLDKKQKTKLVFWFTHK